ncbi:ParB N-terminal domain-containing protein [Desulfosporosinus sp. BICA1-9]|uniref:ParB/RepB/Spo0J family partition protein n=1 Tax=Desulfosporosinus sp. BICA1-9 TaxID=1531958 RepID=UPI00054C3879|nr:ParB N-terminal domain-containing protein [Desulfosporosinus sp. BICA1-9]KJS89140.1 MAG: hypothetical protein JL57_08995 [Desulfosporosinus sp. BICA1-9]
MDISRSKLEEIPVKAIQGNNVLAISVGNREMERSEKAIREYGLIHPLVVSRCDDGHYHIIAGECERMVITQMRQSTVRAVVMECLEAPEATRLALLLSSLKQSSNALSEGLLLKELCQNHLQTQSEVAFMLGRSISWVSKRLALSDRLATSVVELVQAGQICSHTAQEIARLPGDVQQTFAGKVITEHLPKSAVERLVSTYNNPQTPQEVKRSVLENPQTTLEWLTTTEKSKRCKVQDDLSPKLVTLQKLRNLLAMLFRLTGEAEGLLATLTLEERQTMLPMLKQCTQSLWRFAGFAKANLDNVSPGKTEGVGEHGH